MAKSKKSDAADAAAPKSKCPISRDQFRAKAPRYLTVEVKDDKGVTLGSMTAAIKEFDSGSLGFYAGEKVNIIIDGEACKIQAGVNLTIVGSKDLPK